MKNEFTVPGDVYLCYVQGILMRLFKEMANLRVIGNELKWYCDESGTELLCFSIRATGGQKRELARKGWLVDELK